MRSKAKTSLCTARLVSADTQRFNYFADMELRLEIFPVDTPPGSQEWILRLGQATKKQQSGLIIRIQDPVKPQIQEPSVRGNQFDSICFGSGCDHAIEGIMADHSS